MNRQTKGSLLTISGAAFWGLSGTCGQYLMNVSQVNPLWLTSIRMMIAGSILFILSIIKNKHTFHAFIKQKDDVIKLFLFSIFGMLFCQVTYLLAISHSNAGTATVLQYVCPILVIFYTSIKLKTLPRRIELISILLAITGTFLLATHGNINQLSITPSGLFWGLLSAIAYALYTIIPGNLIKIWGNLFITGLGLLIGGSLFFIFIQGWTYTFIWQPYTFISFIGIIGVGTILAYTCFLEGISIVGPVQGSLFASSEPISAVFFSIMLLGETFQAIDLLAIFFIITAVIFISLKDKKYVEHLFLHEHT